MKEKQLTFDELILQTEEQIPEPSVVEEPKPIPRCFKDYVGRCEYCEWGTDKISCIWSCDNPSRHSYRECKDGSFWHPDSWKIPKLCGGCKYHNDFIFEGEDIYHPIEEPNIYCTRDEGSINRQKPFKRFEQPGFGVGYWHRQHEWDTCDGWVASKYFKEGD